MQKGSSGATTSVARQPTHRQPTGFPGCVLDTLVPPPPSDECLAVMKDYWSVYPPRMRTLAMLRRTCQCLSTIAWAKGERELRRSADGKTPLPRPRYDELDPGVLPLPPKFDCATPCIVDGKVILSQDLQEAIDRTYAHVDEGRIDVVTRYRALMLRALDAAADGVPLTVTCDARRLFEAAASYGLIDLIDATASSFRHPAFVAFSWILRWVYRYCDVLKVTLKLTHHLDASETQPASALPRRLHTLDMSHLELANLDRVAFPSESLHTLDLARNNHLGPSALDVLRARAPSLRKLDMGFCRSIGFQRRLTMPSMIHLESLDVTDCDLVSIDVTALCGLRALSIANNASCTFLRVPTSLRALNASGTCRTCSFHDMLQGDLLNILMPELIYLNLADTRLCSLNSLQDLPESLLFLDLSYNKIGQYGSSEYLTWAPLPLPQSLTHLSLRYNALCVGHFVREDERLVAFPTSLKVVDLTMCRNTHRILKDLRHPCQVSVGGADKTEKFCGRMPKRLTKIRLESNAVKRAWLRLAQDMRE